MRPAGVGRATVDFIGVQINGTRVTHVLGGHSWGGGHRGAFPCRNTPPTANHSLELECGEQDLGEASNRYNPGPRLQHSPLDSSRRSDSTPSPFHTAALHQVWDEHIRERYMSLGCYWAELWKLA